MAVTRVLIEDGPQILREIVGATVSAQPDMEIVGIVEGAATLLKMLARVEVDVVILGLGGAELPIEIDEVFERHPLIRVLRIANGGRSAYLHELRPHRQALGEMSPERLVEVIRGAGPAAGVGRRGRQQEEEG
jgi:DNA-binding NarL/FixJ family response regulator